VYLLLHLHYNLSYNLSKKGYAMLQKTVAVVGIILLFIAVCALFAVPGAWLLMLILGALSHMLNIPGLAIGFWASYLICVLLSLFLGGSSNRD